jgi:hypothetical protein
MFRVHGSELAAVVTHVDADGCKHVTLRTVGQQAVGQQAVHTLDDMADYDFVGFA